MAFIQTSAAFGLQDGRVLSADNAAPERHIVVEILRRAGPSLGLKPPVVATLEAMLSCLPPTRSHHTVFASNATLAFRRNGISDRTIRRHVAALEDAGLLVRHDSPNKKRFSRRSGADGLCLRFGFDLSPLFDRLEAITELANHAIREQEKLAYARCKLRAAANAALARNPDDSHAVMVLKLLRRKLSIAECDKLVSALSVTVPEGQVDTHAGSIQQAIVSTNDGQNVRHYQRSNKENIDKKPEVPVVSNQTSDEQVSVEELIETCTEAASFSLKTIRTPEDVIAHARTLAPMMGIDTATYQAADDRLGRTATAVTVWLLAQMHQKIHSVGAYFRSITTGARRDTYDPYSHLRRLALQTGSERKAA